MSYYPDFARLLNENLDRLDRSPAWLARRLGVNPSTVNRWLNHESRPGDPNTVVRIADILGATEQRQELLVAAGYGYQEGSDKGAGAGVEDGGIEAEKAATTQKADRSPAGAPRSAAASPLPVQATALVGRVDELSKLSEWAADERVRLMTVLGPGGMGKTRLALAAAEIQVEEGRFEDGVHFVSLAAIGRRQDMVTAVADTLGLSSAGGDLESTVLNQLQSRNVLIVLDNFEQLLPAADFVATLLATAPLVKLLTTTRERLNLQEEWVLDLNGLTYPAVDSAEEVDGYEAVDLFLQRMEQVNGEFTPTAQQVRSVALICQIVQGMPLGIELAAGWTRVMAVDEIAPEIEQNLDFVATTVRNIPERHRSLRAVFRQSWQMLSTQERRAFSELSVFRGGFSREAAREVTGISLPVLVSLVDKSLVRHTPTGRYEVHELLRHFGAEKLAEEAGRQSAVRRAHAAFYCRFLGERRMNLRTSGQLEALAEIRTEQENVRAAWYSAVDAGQFDLINQTTDSWFQFCELGGYPQQGFQALGYALDAIEREEAQTAGLSGAEMQVLTARVLARHGYLTTRIGGSYPESVAKAERALALLTALEGKAGVDVRDDLAFVHNLLGLALYFLGDEGRADAHVRNALQIAEELGDPVETGRAWSYLGHLAEFQGRFTEAAGLFSMSIDAYMSAGEVNRKAYALNNWGRACYGMGAYDEAESLVQHALGIREEFNDLVGITYSLLDLGRIADCRGEYEEAERLMTEGLAITRTMANGEVSARHLMGLGDVALHTQEPAMAERYLEEGRNICQELGIWRQMPICLAGLGCAAYQRKESGTAASLLEESLRLLIEMGNVGEEARVRLIMAEQAFDDGRVADGARHLQRCLDIAGETGARPVLLAAIALGAHVVADKAQVESPAAADLLVSVMQDPATWHHTRMRAERMLATHGLAGKEIESVQGPEEVDVWSVAQALGQSLQSLTGTS